MWVRTVGSLSIGSVALLAVVSGCGNGSSTSVPSAANLGTPVSMVGAQPDNNGHGKGGGGECKGNFSKGGGGGSKGGGGSVIYTAQAYGHDVKVYSVGSGGLTYNCYVNNGVDEPDGSVATVNGWLYVANGNGNDVLVYRTKHGLPQGPATLTDANFPTNVDTNPNRELVAVSNLGTSSENGNVYVYLHRQSVKSRTLTYGGSETVYGAGIALSHNGNCYWGFNGTTSNSGEIVEFPEV